MKIHELKLESKSDRKRVGRGISAGQGKTAGRGTKGQNARTGGGVRPGFEGGQNPLAKRLPKKRGFKAINPQVFQIVSIKQIASLGAGKIDQASLAAAGLIKNPNKPVKLLGGGRLSKKVEVSVDAASRSAKDAVESAGGSVVLS